MRWMGLVATLLFALTLWQPHAWAYNVANKLLIPGVAAGALRLGTPIPKWFFGQMGRPDKMDVYQVIWGFHAEEDYDLMVILSNDKITALDIGASIFRTKEGIGIGSSIDALRKFYPEGVKSEHAMNADYDWVVKGYRASTHFAINRNKVTEIWMSVED